MAKFAMIEQFRLTLNVPARIRPDEEAAARRTLDSKRFQAELKRAVTAVVRKFPSLGRVRVAVSW